MMRTTINDEFDCSQNRNLLVGSGNEIGFSSALNIFVYHIILHYHVNPVYYRGNKIIWSNFGKNSKQRSSRRRSFDIAMYCRRIVSMIVQSYHAEEKLTFAHLPVSRKLN